jgi:hypothetical protein
MPQNVNSGLPPASFGADDGPCRCGEPAIKLPGSYPQAVTLGDVGKSLTDLKQTDQGPA